MALMRGAGKNSSTHEVKLRMYKSFLELFSTPWSRAGVLMLVSLGLAFLCRGPLSRLFLWLSRGTQSDLDDQVVSELRRPIFSSVVLLGAMASLFHLELSSTAAYWCFSLLKTGLVLIWMVTGIRVMVLLLRWLSERPDVQLVQPRLLPLLDNVARVIMVGGAAYLVLLSWHVDVAAWLTSAGIVGIAIGFAAKDTLANLFAGFFILTDAPYKVGDYINLDSGERGQVTDIGIRSTRIFTRDDVEITIPNSTIASSKIINESGGKWERERVRVTVEAAYGSDIDKVREVLLNVGLNNPSLYQDPEPRVRFRSFGASGLVFQLMGWIERPEKRGRVLDALNTEVYKAFQQAGIEIPFSQHDLWIRGWPPKKPETPPSEGDGPNVSNPEEGSD